MWYLYDYSLSGKSYIGRNLNLKERLNKYKNLLCSEQQGIYHAILKYDSNYSL